VTVGAKNRERRRAKQKARQDQQQRRRQQRVGNEPGSGHGAAVGSSSAGSFGRADRGVLPAHLVEPVTREAVFALHSKDDETVRRCGAMLADGSAGPVGGGRWTRR
jgi:hypothetical protein